MLRALRARGESVSFPLGVCTAEQAPGTNGGLVGECIRCACPLLLCCLHGPWVRVSERAFFTSLTRLSLSHALSLTLHTRTHTGYFFLCYFAKGRVRALLQGDLFGHCPAVRDEDRAQEYARQEPGAPEGVCVYCCSGRYVRYYFGTRFVNR